MAIELVRYKDLSSSRELGSMLHRMVVVNEDHLKERNLLGLLHRYGQDRTHSIDNAAVAMREDNEQEDVQHYVVFDNGDGVSRGKIIGSASIHRQLKLRKLRMPLAPAVADHAPIFAKRYAGGTNITAWTEASAADLLSDTYRAMAPHLGNEEHEWTLEPTDSPEFVHKAIVESGLQPVIDGAKRFDDQTSRIHVPPRAILYGNPAVIQA